MNPVNSRRRRHYHHMSYRYLNRSRVYICRAMRNGRNFVTRLSISVLSRTVSEILNRAAEVQLTDLRVLKYLTAGAGQPDGAVLHDDAVVA